MATKKKQPRPLPSPFEWIAPIQFAEKVEIVLACLLLLPLLRFLATVFFAGMGALWCQLIYTAFSVFGGDPAKQPPLARRVRVALLRWPCMLIQRLWLFALGFWWIEVTGHAVVCGVWRGQHAKVVVANHTSFLDMLVLVWQHNPSFLGKRAILKIPLIGTVGFVNEMIAVDREDIVGGQAKGGGGGGGGPSSNAAAAQATPSLSTKEKIVAHVSDPNAPTMVVFPEGTTCRSDALLQFKAGGAFAHSGSVQPLVLRYNNKTWLPWVDTFEYANTPATATKQWGFRFLCRFRHSLTLTYLPPVTPTKHNGLLGNSVAFANATRAGMAKVMAQQQQDAMRQQQRQLGGGSMWSSLWGGSSSNSSNTPVSQSDGEGKDEIAVREVALLSALNVTEQSYEEFFLFKVACEECKLPGATLRTLDFKRAKREVAEARAALKREGNGANGAAGPENEAALSLTGCKATLRAFALCLTLQRGDLTPQTSSPQTASSSAVTRVSEAALARALGKPHARAVWASLHMALQAAKSQTFSPSTEHALPPLDFQDFLVAMHAARPREAVEARWLSDFGEKKKEGASKT